MSGTHPPGRRFSKVFEGIPGAYYREAAGAFQEARAQTGCRASTTLRVAGVTFRLEFADDQTPGIILPTLAHSTSADDPAADWTIRCWEDASTGGTMPLPTPVMLTGQRHNCLFTVSDQRYRTFYHGWMETLMFIDREGEGYACYLDAAQLPMYEKAAPLRQIFNTALNLRGRQIVHAAAVGHPHGSLLLAGPPRSGKSTLAVQCLLQGMGFQSDDLCVISQDDPPRSWSIYNVAKLRDDSLSRVPSGLPLQSFIEGTEKKHFFHVNRVFPERLLPSAPLKAIVIPTITGESTSRLLQATRLEAMKALIPWSVHEVPTSDNLGEKIMLKALSRLPAYRLELGGNAEQTFTLLQTLLHEA
ncbi:MAG: hypothetical protein SFU85_13095 [Candidatus Methylacidiphilales bacterium]|nr:hypothetical protein [Candidatus Methylacidiphilales bacterium]